MPSLVEIENKIKMMEQGEFQRLCDEILIREGYSGYVALGSQSGTKKTTKGTPDTYFKDKDGKFVFVEYTTMQNPGSRKIREDITKCLDVSKTHIPYEKISKIIYFHSSSNVTPSNDLKFSELCKSKGIKLNIYGINQIALFMRKYPIIARDFLHLPLDSNQILSADDFVKEYDNNRMVAQLSTKFVFRAIEFDSIYKSLVEKNIVIIKGKPGIGKTKLALESAIKFSQEKGFILYCIKNNGQNIENDLKSYFVNPGKYLILIDDANTWKEHLHLFFYYLNKSDYEFKLILTVRKYAFDFINNIAEQYSDYQVLTLDGFPESEIEIFLKNEFGIQNKNYLERINDICKGNIRLAYMAGKLAEETNKLSSLNNVIQLYNVYYRKYALDSGLFSNETGLKILTILGIVSIIHITELKSYKPLLDLFNISEPVIIEELKRLEVLEIVDNNYDYYQISDENFSNYILYSCLIERRIIRISDLIGLCFIPFKQAIINTLNALYSSFYSKEMDDYIRNEVSSVWNKYELAEKYYDFLKVFYSFDFDKTLLFIKTKIDLMQNNKVSIDDNFKIEIKGNINNDIIDLLINLRNSPCEKQAVIFLLQIAIKNYELAAQVLYAITEYYSIDDTSSENDFTTEHNVIDALLGKMNERIIVFLFIQVAMRYLGLVFRPTKPDKKMSVVLYTIAIRNCDSVQLLRKKIWTELCELTKNPLYKNSIIELLDKYSSGWENNSDPSILEFDKPYVKQLLDQFSIQCNIDIYKITKQLEEKYKHFNINSSFDLNKLTSQEVEVYKIFAENHIGISYDEEIKIQEQNILNLLKENHDGFIQELVQSLENIARSNPEQEWKLRNGIEILIKHLSSDETYQFFVAYLSICDYLDFYPSIILEKLLISNNPDLICKIIKKSKSKYKNKWLFGFFESLPKEFCNRKEYKRLIKFLKDKSDADINTSSYRNLSFLEKFIDVNKNVYCKASKIILRKQKYNKFIVSIYFELLFNKYSENTPERLLNRFSENILILKKIYLFLLKYNRSFDNNLCYLQYFCKKDSSWISLYIDSLISKIRNPYDDSFSAAQALWAFEDVVKIITELFFKIIHLSKSDSVLGLLKFKKIFIDFKGSQVELNKQEEWFIKMISLYFQEEKVIKNVFSIIAELPNDRKMKYIKLFIEKNSVFSLFKELDLEPCSYSWSGSQVPILENRKSLFEELYSYFDEIEYVEHKVYMLERIRNLEKYIEAVKKQEYIESIYREF